VSNALDQLWITGFIRPILQPESSKNPDHVAVGETVIQLGDEKYWLYAAGDIDTNELRYTTTEPTTNTVLRRFLANSARNTTEMMLCFSLMARVRYKLRITKRALISDVKHGNRNGSKRVICNMKF